MPAHGAESLALRLRPHQARHSRGGGNPERPTDLCMGRRVTNGARVRPRHNALSRGCVWSFSVWPSVPNAAMKHRNAGPLGTAQPTVWPHPPCRGRYHASVPPAQTLRFDRNKPVSRSRAGGNPAFCDLLLFCFHIIPYIQTFLWA